MQNDNKNGDKEDYTTYYSDIKEHVTEKLLNEMIANRMPLKQDRYAYENQISSKVKKITFTLEDDQSNVYTYNVNLEVTQNGESKSTEITGQISANGNSESILNENFTEK